MRVLHVVRQFHPVVGGLEDVVRSLSGQQRRASRARLLRRSSARFDARPLRPLPVPVPVPDFRSASRASLRA